MTNLLATVKHMLYSVIVDYHTPMKMDIEYRYVDFGDNDFIASKYIFITEDGERHIFRNLTDCIQFLEGYMN